MERFLQATACVLLAVILIIALEKQNKDLATILSIAVVCVVVFAMVGYLEPVLDFARELRSLGQLNSEITGALFKAAGISVIAEIAALICGDAGNTALSKGIHILAVAVLLWLSLPLMSELLSLVQKMMGDV